MRLSDAVSRLRWALARAVPPGVRELEALAAGLGAGNPPGGKSSGKVSHLDDAQLAYLDGVADGRAELLNALAGETDLGEPLDDRVAP